MNHAITIGDLALWIMIVGGLVGVAVIIIGLLTIFNPFRSGH